MKNYSLMIIAICIFLFLAGGCDTNNMLSNADIPKPNEGTQNEQSSGSISEQEGADTSESGGIIIDESNSEEEVIYEEPYSRVDDAGLSINWCIQDGEIKDLEYLVCSEEIVPGNKYSKYDISWAYVDENLYLGSARGWYYTSKIIGSEDKILLRFNSIGWALDAPHFKVFDTSTRDVISIYPDYFEEDYYIESVYVSPDLENIIFLSGTDVYYYHNRQIEKLEQFEGKLEKLNQMVVTMAEGKILVQGDTIDLSEIYCYVYDIATDELTEQKYTNDEYAPDGASTYKVATCEEYRYGTCNRNGYLTLIDFMTGREDETEVLADKIRCISSISEDCFFVLADYAYFFEKSTGRILAKTEHEIAPTKDGESFNVAIVPSDEGLYFYLKGDSAEAAEIYRIEPDE